MEGKPLYFFITYTRKKKENLNDTNFVIPEKKELKPICIYIDEADTDKLFYYNKVFKVNNSEGKNKELIHYWFEFEINDENNEKYIISFDSKLTNFIYDVNLEMVNKTIGIRTKIEQNKEYWEILEFFFKALERNEEENIVDILYKESIELYLKKKSFTFLIVLFLKIYKKKDLCSKLLEIFKKANENPEDNEKNMDRQLILKDYISEFNSIISEADILIKNNNYNSIDFYGIVLCYLNYYDYENFTSTINDFHTKKPEVLYEILLNYNSHLKCPINQNFEFFNKFINYIIATKDFSNFEKGLNYIKDIETYLNIIEKNKEEIFEKYNTQNLKNIIKLDDLKFKEIDIRDVAAEENIYKNSFEKDKIFNVIKSIKSINYFCYENKSFLIYFTNNFWKYLINYYNKPEEVNIVICFKIREAFIEYHKLVIKMFEKKDENFTIKKDVINYFEKDEFAFILDQIIRKYIYKYNKKMKSIEKLAFIIKYNPYYIESKYSDKVDCGIFDWLDLEKCDNEYIKDFKKMNFEIIFKDKILEYINKIFEKIKDIPNIDTVIKLINIKNIEKKNIYLESLNKSYDNIINNKIGLLTDEKLKEAVHITAEIAVLNYIYETKEKKFNFIKNRIKKLDIKIIPLIFFEIINLCFNKKVEKEEVIDEGKNEIINDKYKDFSEMKILIFEEFSNKLDNENDIEKIINLLDCLEGKEEMINEFLQKLISKNLFTKEDFFSCNKNLKITLLYKLYEKGKIQNNEQEYYEKIIELLDIIYQDIGGDIKKIQT